MKDGKVAESLKQLKNALRFYAGAEDEDHKAWMRRMQNDMGEVAIKAIPSLAAIQQREAEPVEVKILNDRVCVGGKWFYAQNPKTEPVAVDSPAVRDALEVARKEYRIGYAEATLFDLGFFAGLKAACQDMQKVGEALDLLERIKIRSTFKNARDVMEARNILRGLVAAAGGSATIAPADAGEPPPPPPPRIIREGVCVVRSQLTPAPIASGDAGGWTCLARASKSTEPQDCDWPVCGCDPVANKVIEALEEGGVELRNPERGRDILVPQAALQPPAVQAKAQIIGMEPCPCGARACKDWHLTGIGKFVRGSGFSKEEAERIIAALSAVPAPTSDTGGV